MTPIIANGSNFHIPYPMGEKDSSALQGHVPIASGATITSTS